MPRTKGASGIVGWQRHSMFRDIAAGELNPDEIAEKYGVATQYVYDTRYHHKSELQAILDDWSNEFSDLWAVQKHARVADAVHDLDQVNLRLAELKEDAERATETMRRVHPEAAPVRVPSREWRALNNLKIKLRDQIAREMGQNATTIDRIAGDLSTPAKLHLLGLTPSERAKAQKGYLTGVDQESPPADLSGFTYSGGSGMTVTEIKDQIAAEEHRHIERSADDAYAKRYGQLMEQHGTTEDLSYLDRWVPPHVEDAVRAAEEQFAKDYPNAMPVAGPVEEPAAEPVEAPEPAPVHAPEPAPVLAEEPAPEPAPELVPEPAPELVEEPEPKPRMTSIEDLRGSIVLTPSYREQ